MAANKIAATMGVNRVGVRMTRLQKYKCGFNASEAKACAIAVDAKSQTGNRIGVGVCAGIVRCTEGAQGKIVRADRTGRVQFEDHDLNVVPVEERRDLAERDIQIEWSPGGVCRNVAAADAAVRPVGREDREHEDLV